MNQPVARRPLSLDRAREVEFADLGACAYLNAASFTPIPDRARRTLQRFDDRRAAVCGLGDEDLVAALDQARSAAAGLVNADPNEIALGSNTSFGINLAAQSLPLPPGSTVVISDREFPANVYPWMARDGVEVDLVPTDELGRPDEERLLERLTRGDVSAFALSSVQFATGYRADLRRFGELCSERGIFFVVDAIQSLGQIPLDVRDARIDILATGAHKWLCAPFGTGFAYVRREIALRIEPEWIGWTGMAACSSLESLTDYRWEFRPDTRRFEGGTLPFDRFAGFAESLGMFAEVGVDRVEAHWRALTEPLLAFLADAPEVVVVSDLEPARRSAILSFRPPQAERVYQTLREAGIVCTLREGAVRISPHLYNTQDDLGRVLEVLHGERRRGWS